MKNQILVPLVLATITLLISCGKKEEPSIDVNTDRTVQYKFSTTYETSVNFTDANGDNPTLRGIVGAWDTTVTLPIGQPIRAYGYNTSDDFNYIWMQITVDGTVTNTKAISCPISGFVSVIDTIR